MRLGRHQHVERRINHRVDAELLGGGGGADDVLIVFSSEVNVSSKV